MSKLETPMIVDYWKRIGGTLIEEFQMVERAKRNLSYGPRRADAVIVPSGENRRVPRGQRAISLEGKDVIVIQAKRQRLGMYLMGQAVFSAKLIKRFNPKSVKSVILCAKDDAVLHPMLAPYRNVEVVVAAQKMPKERRVPSRK